VDLLDWPTAHERWIRARAHAALGHASEAMTWLHGFPDPSGSDLAHVAGAIALRAELATRLGDREQARRDTAVLATPRR